MDSFYIMRNLLMIFCHIVVFWTNLGNCEGSCDNNTQCHYNETRMHSTVRCIFEKAGDTAHPCHGSKVTCFCYSENYQLSSTDNLYMCRPDKWEDGLYDLQCLRRELTTEIPTITHDNTSSLPGELTTEMSTITHDNTSSLPEMKKRSLYFARGEMYANGPEIMYDCPEGWDFIGNMTAVCLYGVWTNFTASPCDEPAPPDDFVIHSPDFAEGKMYANGTEIMYDCPFGWDLNGHMTAVCLYGVWTYEDAYCTASPCDEPAPPDDLVFYSPDIAEGEMYAHGTEIMYDCPDGLDLNGHMTAVCLYGVWTYEDAYCTASPCDEPAPPDDLVSHSPDFAKGEMYANGTEIMYDCPDGWDLNGHMTAVCLYEVWTYENAFCTASPCDEPAPPDDFVFHSPDFAEGEMYANGTEIMYDCPGGLDLNGHMTAVCLYGVWTYEDAYCTASPCDEPAPPDDLVSHSPDFAEGEMYANGTEIMYDCPDGCDLNGNITAVCLSGVWTYEDAYCTDCCDRYTQCRYDERRMHSTVSCNIETARGNTAHPCYGDGSIITCSCKSKNYQLSSPNNSYLCRPDKWEDGLHDLHCLTASPCDEPAPPDDLVFHSPDFAEGEMYANGTEIMYDCPDGWDLNGHMTAVCLYGVWTYEDANCTASPCDEPAPLGDLVFHSPDFAEGEMYANGTEIMYDCPDGLDLNGNMTAVCLHGVWTYEDAYCTGTDSCDKYTQCFYDETRMHSTVSCNYKTAGNTAPPCYGDGSIITCSCKSENYQLSSPYNSYLCRPDKWEDGLYDLHCLTASPCDEPAPPDGFVFHSPNFAKGEMYPNGTEIMYDCPDGLDLNGHMTAVCLYGVWTNEDAYCKASPCDEPAPQDDLVFHSPDFAEGEMYAHGTEIMYDCPDGLDLSGHMTAVCLYGVWTHEDAYCTGSCDKYTQCHYNETRMHSTVSCKNETAGNTTHPCYGDGSKVTCSCRSENYQLSSPNNSYLCRPDKWEDGLYDLHCLTASPCDEPAPPDDLVIHSPDFAEGEMYANGTEIMYDCPDELDLNGHMTAVCLYGKWTNEDAYCTASPCDKPTPPDGFVFHSPNFAKGEMYENGTEIMYDCPEGWDSNGNMTAVCLNGVWTYEDAYCTASPCGKPAPPCYLVFHYPGFAEGEMYANGTEIMYFCPDGDYLNGNRIAVCLYGKWTYENASCKASPCDEPAPPDDLVFHSPDFAEGEMYANGTEIMYYCPNGLDLNGHMTAVCLYGVWTYEDAYCTASQCGKPAPPCHLVSHSPGFAEREMYPNGSEIMYYCPNGDYLNGNRIAVCINGKWTYENASCKEICDKYTQCHYNETRMHSTVSCNFETTGNTAPPCYGDGSTITCSCNSENYQLSSPKNSYLCRPDKWEDGLYDLYCFPRELTTEISTTPIDTTTIPIEICDKYTQCHYYETRMHSTVICNIETAGNTAPPCYGDGSIITCSCNSENYQLSSPNNSYLCRPDKWEDGLYDLYCFPNPILIPLVIIIAIFTLLFAVLLIWLVKKHCLRRGTEWIPSVEGVANEQLPPTANDDSKFVSKVTFEMSDPNGYQNDVNKEDNDVTDHVGDNSRGDLPNNDPKEETV